MAKRRGVEVPKTPEIDVPPVTGRPATDNETYAGLLPFGL